MFYLRNFHLLNFLYFVYDVLMPRFVTREVAFVLCEEIEGGSQDEYMPLCDMEDLHEDDDVHMVGTIRSFNLFGFGLFPKLIGELHPFDPEATIQG